jgi:hypothetical protein
MRRVFPAIEKKLAESVARSNEFCASGHAPEENAYEVASRAGLIGCLGGEPGSPTDLSTNPEHMKDFGRGEETGKRPGTG